MINYFFEDVPEFGTGKYTNWLKEIIISEGKKPGTLTFVFCSDEYLLRINRDFLQHDYYTDIITFDHVRGKTVSGEIFISLQRISDNSNSLCISFDKELLRVLAHGILHLCGYGDKKEEEITMMRAKENFYIETYVSRETIDE